MKRAIVLCVALVFSHASVSHERSVIVEMYGDSTTLGAQTRNGVLTTTPNSEPNELQDLLQETFGRRVAVVNNGVGGTEAFQLLAGTDGRNRPWAQQMASSPADIIILNFALNDHSYWSNPVPGKYAESPEMYANIIGWLIQTARNNGKIVVLQEPNPTCYQPVVGNLQKFADALRNEATIMGAPLVAEYDYIQTLPGWKELYSDCVHPLDPLYKLKAQRTYNVVAPIVHKLTR